MTFVQTIRFLRPVSLRGVSAAFLGVAWVTAVGLASPVRADTDACRDWQIEHREWKVEALQAYLRSRPREAQDETMFELLQREAYLTSCEADLRITRSEMVGWRLVDRALDEYPVALTESVLVSGGFDLDLSGVSAGPAPFGRITARRPWRRGARPLSQGDPIDPIDRVRERRR